jgi:DNA processing protein
MQEDDLLYKLALTMIAGVGGATVRKLMAHFGSPKAIFDLPSTRLEKIFNASVFQNFNRDKILKQAEKEIEFINANGIKTLFYTDSDYPYRLNRCDDTPAVLYVKGKTDLNNSKSISIVGTRKASSYGLSLCRQFVFRLAEKGYKPLIISGLAYGIDICAHTAALEAGLETVAVMGTGLNTVYPAAHGNIAKQIENNGALISEYSVSQPVIQGNFISRNRTVAALADVTVVVESAAKGGALITADIANSYNRDVMTFPGRVGDEFSQGCNNLIKANKAALIESVEDFEYQMNWSAKPQTVQKQLNFIQLSQPEQEIVSFLKDKKSEDINSISFHTGISIPELSVFMLNLEFVGLIEVLPGNSYSLKNR